MVRVTATGFDDIIEADRPAIYVSSGAGNSHGLPEVHLTAIDPLDGTEIRFWVFKDDLLAAVLDSDAPIRVTPVLGATLEEPTA